MLNGYYVVEGVDCTGKTTLIEEISKLMDCITIRQPGGTELAEQVRSMTKMPEVKSRSIAKQLLMSAANYDTYDQYFDQFFDNVVIADRSVISGYIYFQTELEMIKELNGYFIHNRHVAEAGQAVTKMIECMLQSQRIKKVFYLQTDFRTLFQKLTAAGKDIADNNLLTFFVKLIKNYNQFFTKVYKRFHLNCVTIPAHSNTPEMLAQKVKDFICDHQLAIV